MRHKVAIHRRYTSIAINKYRQCTFFVSILGRTQNLPFAVNGLFMQRRSQIACLVITIIIIFCVYSTVQC